jgi:diguanylate cyclase (GGDEF)-like protein/PAS domain S-box-containing protein
MPDPASPLTSRSHLWAGGVLFLLAIAGGWLFTDFVVRTGSRLESARVRSLATTAAAALESDRIALLTGTAADTGTPALAAVRAELARVRAVNPDFRFVYLMRPTAAAPDKMVFLADAEAVSSPDYSAPGDVYDGPSTELVRVFRTGVSEIQAPYRDRWGYWVTSAAPVTDARSGKVLAVLGMDVNADAWLATEARYRAFALAISGLVAALVLLFTLGLHLQKRAQAGLRLADVVVRHTREGIVVLDRDLRIESVNPGFERITGFARADVLQQTPAVLAAQAGDSDVLQHLRSSLAASQQWEGLLLARRRNGDSYPLEGSLDAVRDSNGDIVRHVMVFRDVTVQKQLEERLRELSATDALTLVANRRTFDETLEREWHRAMRSNSPVSLVMADIDFFKPYNDIYGHVAGDRCLQQVASAIAAGVQREGALVARYGGEEFAVILPGTDETAAREVAERVRRHVEALAIAHTGNPDTGRITISMGTSTRTPPQTADFISLMQSADMALYRAKEGGRNTVAS